MFMPRRVVLFLVLGLLAFSESRAPAQSLPGTKLYTEEGDPAAAMVAGIHAFLDRELAASVKSRVATWNVDGSSPEAHKKSVERMRERFRTIIGAVGERVSPVELNYVSGPGAPALLVDTPSLSVYAVRWGVYPGVVAEGLLIEPKGAIKANVVAMMDCDTPPEAAVGLLKASSANAQVGLLLGLAGCRVLMPTLIDRSDEFSGNANVRMTNLPHREWIYRMAYETGRHIIGYEVDKVRAAVDWFTRDGEPQRPIGVFGHGEGGLIAFYAAAVDTRINTAWISGYFGPREEIWKEPIYRNVWGLLESFGDAEILALIMPRPVHIENASGPEVTGPPPPRKGRSDAASGRLSDPAADQVNAEMGRLSTELAPVIFVHATISAGDKIEINSSNHSLTSFLIKLGITGVPYPSYTTFKDPRSGFDPRTRMKRQLTQLVDYTQNLIRTSELRRDAYWSKADMTSPEGWDASTESYRRAFQEDLIGRFPQATEPLEARTRQIFDEPGWTGYAVQIPVWPDVVASGILLLPKDLKEGERRPVIVCQHGLEGRPDEVVNPRLKSVYNSFGARLADRGYIVYAPQNPYIGRDNFRLLVRKANPLKRSLFSVIVGQHERTLEWLATLPNVDRDRIAFYGLSYGGKTAMRVPAILKNYCLSICSADFNEWVVKCTNVDRTYSYLYTLEYDMYEFGLAERFNYAEMAGLIAPRPFMVERGHKDPVAPDEWIGYEYAKVRRLYDMLGIGDRTEIAYFNAGHMIDGKATFAFLAKHLNWPRGEEK
jgi:cephalosporin-C deacetylase-like acetyl esterase